MKGYKFISVIITHWGMDKVRSDILGVSLDSLFRSTDLPLEIIVIDNGGNISDSQYLLGLTNAGKITTYIRNANNMSFGFARNQGLSVCNGDYIVVADNDILYLHGWLEPLIRVLDKYPKEKIYATPVYNVAHWLPKFWDRKTLETEDGVFRLNSRAGSNCWVMRREDFKIVGKFLCHRVAGTKWTERAIELGYMAAVAPKVMVDDLGFRNGYNYKNPAPVKMILSNGDEVYFSEDEFRRLNRKNYYFRKQESF